MCGDVSGMESKSSLSLLSQGGCYVPYRKKQTCKCNNMSNVFTVTARMIWGRVASVSFAKQEIELVTCNTPVEQQITGLTISVKSFDDTCATVIENIVDTVSVIHASGGKEPVGGTKCVVISVVVISL